MLILVRIPLIRRRVMFHADRNVLLASFLVSVVCFVAGYIYGSL